MSKSFNRGWIVVLSGLCINLMFGVLYAWSIFSANLSSLYKWTSFQASLPYTVAIVVFALIMLVGGKLQDIFGPRIVATAGGAFTGLGLVLSSVFPTLTGVIICFGVLTGAGIGMGYSATTPAAVKWFRPEQKGLIAGIVVTGFGLAALYIAPLTKFLIASYGVFDTFRILGIVFGLLIMGFAQLLSVPKEQPAVVTSQSAAAAVCNQDYNWRQMLKTPQFYLLWMMFLAGSMAGLILIGHLAKIAVLQTGINMGVTLVSIIAISNALGRPVAGFVSDKIGRGRTMTILYLMQGATLLMFSGFNSFASILIGAMVITFSYGAMLSVYPSAIADFYGTRNMGFNYAILFTAWGVAGVSGPLAAGYILDITGGYNTAYLISSALCFFAAVLGMIVKAPAAERACCSTGFNKQAELVD
ncbi:MAG TPA: OFA family MFS transporter [Deltaproteobacteria bacterium]|nr:OFA family MFS transporter [Deltaproteobacteria bacterium]HQB37812.1 OFA family MFS transporter [Deltaproteobacteria bacterium]